MKISDYATKGEVEHDIDIWRTTGLWSEGVPEWAVACGEHLDVATGSMHIYVMALEYLLGYRE